MQNEKKFFASLKEKVFKKDLKKKDTHNQDDKFELKEEKSENEWFHEYEVIYQSYVLET